MTKTSNSTTKDTSAEGSVIRMLEPVAKTASLMTRSPTTIPETISPVIGLLASVTKTTISTSLVIRKLRSIAKTTSLATRPPTSIACRKALATGLTTYPLYKGRGAVVYFFFYKYFTKFPKVKHFTTFYKGFFRPTEKYFINLTTFYMQTNT